MIEERRAVGEMLVLVSFGWDHSVYGDVLAHALRVSRPRVEVEVVRLDALEEEVSRLEPGLVIRGCTNAAGSAPADDLDGGPAAWAEISLDPRGPSSLCVDGRRRELQNPSLDDLLSVLDEAEEVLAATEHEQDTEET